MPHRREHWLAIVSMVLFFACSSCESETSGSTSSHAPSATPRARQSTPVAPHRTSTLSTPISASYALHQTFPVTVDQRWQCQGETAHPPSVTYAEYCVLTSNPRIYSFFHVYNSAQSANLARRDLAAEGRQLGYSVTESDYTLTNGDRGGPLLQFRNFKPGALRRLGDFTFHGFYDNAPYSWTLMAPDRATVLRTYQDPSIFPLTAPTNLPASVVDQGPRRVGQGTGSATLASHLFARADCTNPDYSEPLGVEAEAQDEIDYLDDVIVCTNTSRTTIWLQNKSDVVWEIYRGPEKMLIEGATAFRTMFGRTAFAPDDTVVFPSDSQYEWHVNYELSANWVLFDLFQDKFQSYGEQIATRALDKRTPIGAAVLTCGLAFADVARLDSSEEADEIFANVLEAGAEGAQCRESARRLEYADASGKNVRMLDDLLTLERQAATLEEASTALRYAKAAGKWLTIGFHLVHRG